MTQSTVTGVVSGAVAAGVVPAPTTYTQCSLWAVSLLCGSVLSTTAAGYS